nr:hypothetical protein [Tanacetum cinerariifolium]
MSNINNNMQTQTSNTLHNAIMEADSKDRPPMLAPGNYIQWKSRIKRYIDTKPNHELIHFCLMNPPYELGWKDKPILDSKGNSNTVTQQVFETFKNVTQEIRDQLNAEAEAVQIILTGIDNDIYSTVDACPNVCEMWKAIERLKEGESINVQDLETNLFWEFRKFTSLDGESLESYYSRFYKLMNELTRNQCKVTNHQVNVQFLFQLQPEWQRFVTLMKQSQELKHVSYHKLYDILKQQQHEVNEIRAKKIARVANPLALVMARPVVSVSADSPEESFGETIKIGVDVTHPMPVTLAIFPASTIVMRLAQHEEAIRGIQEHLLEVPIQEGLRALRDSLDVAEAERATLRAMVRIVRAVETSLCNRMRDARQTHIEIERHLVLVLEELTQSRISH